MRALAEEAEHFLRRIRPGSRTWPRPVWSAHQKLLLRTQGWDIHCGWSTATVITMHGAHTRRRAWARGRY